MRDHVELQSRLLQCAGGDPPCERVSSWVVQAIRPAELGRRTDAVLFGLCSEHRHLGRAIAIALGFQDGVVVEWAALGDLLREMDAAGLLAS